MSTLIIGNYSKMSLSLSIAKMIYNYLNEVKKYSVVNLNSKYVIYTVVFGDYDHLRTPKYIDSKFEYICFTDNKEIGSDFWRLIKVESFSDPRFMSRLFKVSSSQLFPESNYVVWVDAQCQLKKSLSKLILEEFSEGLEILCFKHRKRSSVFSESTSCFVFGKEKFFKLVKNYLSYRKQGFDDKKGLVETGILITRTQGPSIENLNYLWASELINRSLRDQLSFLFVAWKSKVKYKILDSHIHDYAIRVPHNKYGIYKKNGEFRESWQRKIFIFLTSFTK